MVSREAKGVRAEREGGGGVGGSHLGETCRIVVKGMACRRRRRGWGGGQDLSGRERGRERMRTDGEGVVRFARLRQRQGHWSERGTPHSPHVRSGEHATAQPRGLDQLGIRVFTYSSWL